jgi:hypothetical protein
MQDPDRHLRMSGIDDPDLSIDTAIRAVKHCLNLGLENVSCWQRVCSFLSHRDDRQ